MHACMDFSRAMYYITVVVLLVFSCTTYGHIPAMKQSQTYYDALEDSLTKATSNNEFTDEDAEEVIEEQEQGYSKNMVDESEDGTPPELDDILAKLMSDYEFTDEDAEKVIEEQEQGYSKKMADESEDDTPPELDDILAKLMSDYEFTDEDAEKVIEEQEQGYSKKMADESEDDTPPELDDILAKLMSDYEFTDEDAEKVIEEQEQGYSKKIADESEDDTPPELDDILSKLMRIYKERLVVQGGDEEGNMSYKMENSQTEVDQKINDDETQLHENHQLQDILYAKEMQSLLPKLADSRYVGIGYEILQASPEGTFSSGGVDPGLRTGHHIFNFTYNERKKVTLKGRRWRVPDQVNYQPYSSCTSRTERQAYSGSRSYQSSLALGIKGAGSYGLVMFSASQKFSQATSSISSSHKVMVDSKQICNYASLHYRKYGPRRMVTTDFSRAVNELPTSYSKAAYFDFIRSWGTHIIFGANLGTKTISRKSVSYMETVDLLKQSSSTLAGLSFGSAGSVEVSIDAVNQRVHSGSSFRSAAHTFNIGSREYPLPIGLELKPIYEALLRRYWDSASYTSSRVATKWKNMKKAYEDYKQNGHTLRDPRISIPLEWPEGTYAFPQPSRGCPVGFVKGCWYQDNEDRNNANRFQNTGYLKGSFGRNIRVCYCLRKVSRPSQFTWPRGRYCINRFNGNCPSGFYNDGKLKWDDEDLNNKNRKTGEILPSGQYNRNTVMWYCCRGDGNVNRPVILPTQHPFVLYMFHSRGCQKVAGMCSREIFIRTDDEDSNNANYCRGQHPYDEGCNSRDHKIFMCYYYKC